MSDGLSAPAHTEARALQALERQISSVQRAASAAAGAERQLSSAMKTANAAPKAMKIPEVSGRGALGDHFMAEALSQSMQTLTGGGVLSSIGTTIGGAIAGPLGAAIGSGIGGALDAVVSAVQRAASAVYGLGKSFFLAVSQASILRDRAISAFEALRGKGQGAKGFEDIQRIAKEMGTGVADTFDGIRALTAAGFNTGDAERWFKRMQDLSAIGIDGETQKRVVLAMSQIKGAGALQGDELWQLQDTGLNIDLMWQSISKQMGVTTQEAKKLKEQGKVSADIALVAIEEAIAKMTGGGPAGEARKGYLDKTFGGALDRLKSGGEQWLMKVADKAAPSFERLAGTAKGLMAALESKDSERWILTAAAGIDSIVAGLELAGSLVLAFAEGLGLIDSTKATQDMASSLRELGKNKDILDAMRTAGAAAAFAIGGIAVQVQWLASALAALAPYVAMLSNLATMPGQMIGGFLGEGGGTKAMEKAQSGLPKPAEPGGLFGKGGLIGDLATSLPLFGMPSMLTPALPSGPQPGGALRAPQPSDFVRGPASGWTGAQGASTTNTQNNSVNISVTGGDASEGDSLAAKIGAEVKRQLQTMGAQLGV